MSVAAISKIDQQIDAIRKDLSARERIQPLNSASWQAAWGKHPDLRNRERELFRQRGVAQQERDEKAAKIWRSHRRETRLRKCPTCGSKTLAVGSAHP